MPLLKFYSRLGSYLPRRRAVRGMALFELSIAVSLAGIMTVSGLVYYKRQIQDDSARALAKQYEIMNNAVGVYMSNHWTDLLSLGQACNNSGWNTTSSQAWPSECSRMLGSVFVRHALQPTMSELIALGYLSQGSSGPILTFDPAVIVYTFAQSTGATASHTFGTWIQIYCTKIANSTSLTQCPTLSDRTLRSVVFNTRPYLNIQGDLYSILANTLSALPGDAGMSIPFFNDSSLSLIGRSQSLGSEPMSASVVIPNPVKVSAGSSTGIFGILGIRNVHASPLYTLRDGSMSPTNSWEFNNKNLTEVNKFAAQQVHAASSLLIPNSTPGVQCDPSGESVAISQAHDAILYCDKDSSRWSFPQARGIIVDSRQSFEADLTFTRSGWARLYKTPGAVHNPQYARADEWAMPSISKMHSFGSVAQFTDTYCEFVSAETSSHIKGGVIYPHSHQCATGLDFSGSSGSYVQFKSAYVNNSNSFFYQGPLKFELGLDPEGFWAVRPTANSDINISYLEVFLYRIAR